MSVCLSLCLTLFVYMCLSACISVYVSVCASANLSVCTSASLSLSAYLSLCLSTNLFLGLSLHLSACLFSLCPSVCLSVCPSVSQSISNLSEVATFFLFLSYKILLRFPSIFSSSTTSSSLSHQFRLTLLHSNLDRYEIYYVGATLTHLGNLKVRGTADGMFVRCEGHDEPELEVGFCFVWWNSWCIVFAHELDWFQLLSTAMLCSALLTPSHPMMIAL